MSRAATTRLEPGQHSIDRANPWYDDDLDAWRLSWSVRLHDGRLKRHITQAPTKGQVRARARAKADELLTTHGGASPWKLTDSMGEYVEKVGKPAIENAKLAELSRKKYRALADLLIGACAEHKHEHSMQGHSIASGTRFRALEKCLQEISKLHGAETARNAKNVLSKYVLQQLIRDELLTGNPLQGMSIDLVSQAKVHENPKPSGEALTREDYQTVLTYLLDLDPAEGVVKRQGRWGFDHLVNKRRNLIALTLLQMATGMRIGESNLATWERHVRIDDDGHMLMALTPDITKTKRGRTVPVLDPRVQQYLLKRQNEAQAIGPVIGAPVDRFTVWDRQNCQTAVRNFYRGIAGATGVQALEQQRSHVWRITLNSLLIDTVPEVIRAAFFGHDIATNRASYTDLHEQGVVSLLGAAATLRAA